MSRASHYRAKAKHAQREFGQVAPKLPARDTDTTWIGPFVESLQGHTEPFDADSQLAASLGSYDERVIKLRKLSSMGILDMSVLRLNDQFVGYRWSLSDGGRLRG